MAFDSNSVEAFTVGMGPEEPITDEEREAGYPSIGGWNPTTRGSAPDMRAEDWDVVYPGAMHRMGQPDEYRTVVEKVETGWEAFLKRLGLGRQGKESKKPTKH